MRTIFLAFLLMACGQKTKPVLPDVENQKLTEAIKSVESQLAWTCDNRIPARRPGIECAKEGDGVSTLGRWILDTGDKARFSGILDSVGADGRPYRNPDRRALGEIQNSFSRDQLLGLLEATVATRNRTGLQSLMQFVQKTGRLCDGDDRCDLTPSVRILINETLGKSTSALERAQDEVTIQAEAMSAPASYRAYLVARKIMLHARLNTMTKGYATAAKTLANRYPNNLFVATVDAIANDRSFAHIASNLEQCLVNRTGSGTDWWGDEMANGCKPTNYGHHHVALGYLLTRLQKDEAGLLQFQ